MDSPTYLKPMAIQARNTSSQHVPYTPSSKVYCQNQISTWHCSHFLHLHHRARDKVNLRSPLSRLHRPSRSSPSEGCPPASSAQMSVSTLQIHAREGGNVCKRPRQGRPVLCAHATKLRLRMERLRLGLGKPAIGRTSAG